jgi:hypothetical protein
MTDAGFDVLVIAFAPRAHETAGSALARVAGMPAAHAEALCRALPCVVLSDVGYAQAESVAASLSLAGAEASVRPHQDEPHALDEPGRLTMPELGVQALYAAGIGAGRESGLRAPAPATLRPPNVSDAQPAVVFGSSSRVAQASVPMLDVVQAPPGPARPGMETVREVVAPAAATESAPAQGWALELDLAPKAPPPSTIESQGFAADFGQGLELDVMPVSRARAPERPPSEPPDEPDPPEPARLSLDFRLSFPSACPAPAPAPAPPVASVQAHAPLGSAAERSAPRVVAAASPRARSEPPSGAPSTRPAAVPRPLLEADGTIRRSTLYLLAMLWASVGLLLWTHDLF